MIIAWRGSACHWVWTGEKLIFITLDNNVGDVESFKNDPAHVKINGMDLLAKREHQPAVLKRIHRIVNMQMPEGI